MNLIELNRALRQLRLGGIAAVLETRLQQAQAEPMAPIDFLSCLVSDELTRCGDCHGNHALGPTYRKAASILCWPDSANKCAIYLLVFRAPRIWTRWEKLWRLTERGN